MHKLLRLVFTLIALFALAGFGYAFYDFYINKDAYMANDDIQKFKDSMPPPPAPKPGHLKDWREYKSMYSMNVIGYVEPEKTTGPGGTGTPVKVKKVNEGDLRVSAINLSNDPQWSTAWIEPSAAGPVSKNPLEVPGNLYRVGDKFTIPKEPNVKIEVLAITADYEVELQVEGQDGTLVVQVSEYEVTQTNIQTVDQRGRPVSSGSGAVRPPITITTESAEEPGTFDIGSDDLQSLSTMSDDSIAAAVRIVPARDPDGTIRGLRINTIQKGSMFERMGVQVDDILLSVNGQPANDRAELTRWLRQQRDTRTFRAEVERRGGVRTITYRVPQLR